MDLQEEIRLSLEAERHWIQVDRQLRALKKAEIARYNRMRMQQEKVYRLLGFGVRDRSVLAGYPGALTVAFVKRAEEAAAREQRAGEEG